MDNINISMKNVYMFQPNFATKSASGKETCWLPYSTAVLWGYAEQNDIVKNNFNLAKVFFKREPIENVISNMENPHVAVFSCYTWNWEYTKQVASAIKKKWSACTIIFGGPQVPEKPDKKGFFETHPYVDIVVNGEGEPAFLDILLRIHDNLAIEKVVTFPRMKDLNTPSPYDTGIFEKLMKENPEILWNATLETNRGCPYQCTYCDWGSLTQSKIKCFSEERVLRDIEWISNHQIPFVFIADANFGIFVDRDMKFTQYLRKMKDQTGYPTKVYATWAKSFKRKETLEIVKEFFKLTNYDGLTVSIQSMNETTLDMIKRSTFQLNDIGKVVKECNNLGMKPYVEFILGLPGETKESWKSNYCKLLEMNGEVSGTQIHLLSLLENADLNDPEQRLRYGIKTIKVSRNPVGVIETDNLITEQEELVCETNTMPFDDLIESFMFTYVTKMYYDVGWFRLVLQFLHKYNNVPTETLFSHLENSLINGDYYISKEYRRIRSFFKAFMSNEEYEEDHEDLIGITTNLQWASLADFHINQDLIYKELTEIFSNDYCMLPEDLYNNLIELQKQTMYSKNNSYPSEFNDTYGIHKFITENTKLGSNTKLTINYPFEPLDFTDKNMLFVRLFNDRRLRGSNTVITIEE